MSDRFSPAQARKSLRPLGRLLYDTEAKTLWDRDTETLPRSWQRLRRHYRAFAREHLVPRALAADVAVDDDAIRGLFTTAARAGLQTELLPPPLGTGSVKALSRGDILWPAVLKAEELCTACAGLALGLLAHDLGCAPLLLAGDLRGFRWLGRIYRECRAGEPALTAFAITEPGAGSDVEETEGARSAQIVTRARRVNGGFCISGRKCFITGGRLARRITLFAALGGGGVDSWTCFLLDASMAGLSVGRRERKMGQRAADASELVLEDVLVPDDRVIGGLEAGWALNRNVLNYSRPAVGAIAVGIARGAFERALDFCRRTRLGNRPLIAYQDVQLRLADMLGRIQAARALVWQTARYGIPCQAAGAMPKAFAARVAWEVSTEAMELLGDHGYLHANGVEKAARDARLTMIYEGTEQINLLAVIEGQQGAEL